MTLSFLYILIFLSSYEILEGLTRGFSFLKVVNLSVRLGCLTVSFTFYLRFNSVCETFTVIYGYCFIFVKRGLLFRFRGGFPYLLWTCSRKEGCSFRLRRKKTVQRTYSKCKLDFKKFFLICKERSH